MLVVCLMLFAVSAAAGPLKGIASISEYSNACDEVDTMEIGWWYNWKLTPSTSCHTRSEFIPMVWSGEYAKDLSSVNKSAPLLLGFNEPDNSGQSNMSPSEAASLWHYLEATGMPLGSPAVSAGTGAIRWLDEFFGNCTGCRVDVIAVHWYSPWSSPCSPQDFYSYVSNFAKYGKPLWITELDCADGTFDDNLNFMKAALPGLGKALPNVERYAWFTTRSYNLSTRAAPAFPVYSYTNLFDDEGNPTVLGDYYQTLPTQ